MKDILVSNILLVHTTPLGVNRIKNNLDINIDPVSYVKDIILNKKSEVIKKGKNYYVSFEDNIITINSYNFCIITAHKK